MQMDPSSKEEWERELLLRLKKIEGQVRGITRLIQEGCRCGEIVPQLAAVKATINQVAVNTLVCHLAEASASAMAQGKDPKASVAEFGAALRKFAWGKLPTAKPGENPSCGQIRCVRPARKPARNLLSAAST